MSAFGWLARGAGWIGSLRLAPGRQETEFLPGPGAGCGANSNAGQAEALDFNSTRPAAWWRDLVGAPGKSWTRQTIGLLLLAVVYFAAGEIALFCSSYSTTTVWPPYGLALAALLVFGYRVWPGIFLGACFIGLGSSGDPTALLAVALSSTAQALIAAWLVNLFAGGCSFYERPKTILRFALLAGALCPLLSPPIGMVNPSLRSLSFWASREPSFLVWWFGEMMSVVVLTPFLVLWGTGPRVTWTKPRMLEFVLLLLALDIVAAAVFGDLAPTDIRGYVVPYLCLPFLVWAAFRFGARETMTAACVLGAVALYDAVKGYGLFAHSAPAKALVAYQGFIAFTSLLGLSIASVVAQRQQARDAILGLLERLEHRVRERTQDLQNEVHQRIAAEKKLQLAHAELEHRVEERTAALRLLNRSLELEAAERRRAEQACAHALNRVVESQEAERRRVSRELHDELGQQLTALKMGLTLVRQGDLSITERHDQIAGLEKLADKVMRDMHRLAWELRPTALDDFGLELALRRFAEECFKRSGTRLCFASHGLEEEERLGSKLETTLYRVAQEAFNNVAKHAHAQRISVVLIRKRDTVSLIIKDDGKGFDPEAGLTNPGPDGSLGLMGMRERVKLAGGSFTIKSSPDAGTTVYVRVPLRTETVVVEKAVAA